MNATTLLRDLAVLVDTVDADAHVDDMLVALLPGESAAWEIMSSVQADPDAFLLPTGLRSAKQLVRGP